jgi:hypothetical protein
MDDAVVVCIARYEECYVEEWIRYHLDLGFSRVYIYDNSDDNSLARLHNDVDVVVLHFPGVKKQLEAYNNFFIHRGHQHRWCAVIDCDEFIVLKKHADILSFLHELLPSGGLAINWVLYGCSGHKVFIDKPVRQRFVMRQVGVDPHVKCIVCCADVVQYNNPHYPTKLHGVVRDVHGAVVEGHTNPKGDDSVCQINHYYTKSHEEFNAKFQRTRADTNTLRHHDRNEVFNFHDRNEVLCDTLQPLEHCIESVAKAAYMFPGKPSTTSP